MAYSKTRYSRGIVSTLSLVNTLPSPQTGETCFCSENGRVMTYDGQLWMCDDFIKATNSSGSSRSVGDLMVWVNTSGTTTEVTTSTSAFTLTAGVVVYNSNSGSPVALAHKGIYRVNIQVIPPTYNRLGFFLRLNTTTAGAGTLVSTSASTGIIGWNVEVLGGSGLGLTRCLLKRIDLA